jgi:hypothetical protein
VLKWAETRRGAGMKTYLIVSLIVFAALTLYGLLSGQLTLP